MFIDFLRLFLFSLIFRFFISLISIFLQRYKIIKLMPLNVDCMIRLFSNISLSLIVSVFLSFFRYVLYDFGELNELLFLFCIIFVLELSGIRNKFILIINKLIKKFIYNMKEISKDTYYLNYNAEPFKIKQTLYIFIFIYIVDLISLFPIYLILENKFLFGFIILSILDLLSTFLIYINRIIKNNFIVLLLLLILPFSRVLSLWGMAILFYQDMNFIQVMVWVLVATIIIWILPNILRYNLRESLYKTLMKPKIFLFLYIPYSGLIICIFNLINNQKKVNVLSFLLNPELIISFVMIVFGLYFYSLISFQVSIHIFEMNQEKKELKVDNRG